MTYGIITAVRSVTGTGSEIDSSGGTNPVISIDNTYPGQASITTLGTITSGTWDGGIIGLTEGGTNANLTASNGGIFYSTGTAGAILAGTATARQILLSGSNTTPAWSTATYPATTTINQLLYSSAANVISGLSTSNNGVLLTSGTGVPSIGTATVPVGGTGNTTFTAYSLICAGTTATGIFQNVVGLGSLGQVLTSAGGGALPAWQTPSAGTVSSVSGTAGQIDVANPTTTPVISIDAAYVGQTSITTLGTIGTGVWNGTAVTVPYGGTGNTTFTAYSVICAGTTATGIFQNVSGVGSLGQVLTSNGASALPTWQNSAGGVIVNQNTSSVTMVAGSRYFINNGASLVTLTLPVTAAQGDTFYIVGGSSGGWTVAQNNGQQINVNSSHTTSGAGGSLSSTQQYNCIEISCTTANTTFVSVDASGSITVV